MTLRKRTIAYIAISLAIVTLVISSVAYFIQMYAFDNLESMFLQASGANLRRALKIDIDKLEREAKDYQNWNEAYDFVAHPTSAFIEDNFAQDSMENVNVDIIAYFDDSGKMLVGQNINPATNELEGIPPSVIKLIERDIPGAKDRCGILFHTNAASLPEGVLLYSLRPFFKNDGTGPARGVGLMGRWLSEKMLNDYDSTTGMHVKLNTKDFDTSRKPLSELKIDGDNAKMFITFLDENNKPAFQLVGERELLVHKRGLIATRMFVIVVISIGAIMGVVLVIILNRRVLQRIFHISAQVRGIAESGDSSQRIAVESGDELGRLGNDINALLSRLGESESNLLKKQKQIELLIENSPLAITISDENGKILMVNERYRELTGYTAEEIGTLDHLNEIFMPDTAYRAEVCARIAINMQAAKASGKRPEPVEYTVVNKRGETIEVETYKTEAGGLLFRIVNDVTARNKTMRELKAASEAKSLFLANMSHEIRTPLNGIVGMAQILANSEMTADQRGCVKVIIDSGKLLETVISDILDIARIESGEYKLSHSPTNMNDLVQSVSSLVVTGIESKGLEFICEVAPGTHMNVICDSDRLKQVLLNLLGNATKFTDMGFVKLTINSRKIDEASCVLSFEVADSGIGIAPEDRERVFKPFVQSDVSHTRKYGGTGLGLTISRSFVRLMGGDIKLESELGKGTKISFEITVRIGNRTDTSPIKNGMLDPGMAAWCPVKILVAEDNLVNRRVIGTLLNKMGYHPDYAANGAEAQQMAFQHNYDLILMDVQMPIMDGIAATISIRSGLPETLQPQIFALTAHALDEDEKRCTEAGMNGHITKPVKIPVLKETIFEVWKKKTAA